MILPPPAPPCYRLAQKPQRLSDPHYDFDPQELTFLLAKNVHAMTWVDYQNLFGPILPAGTYDELRHFVPHFVRFLWDHPECRLDLVHAWAGFAGENWGEICGDRAADYVHAVHRALLAEFTRQFDITHYDRDACAAKGWRSPHFDHVQGAEALNQFLCKLWEYESQRPIAWEFLQHLADFGDDCVRCFWFLELSKSRFEVYSPPYAAEVTALLENPNTLGKALNLILKHQVEGSYWDDTLQKLGI
ncbi:MAG: hypothetical protein RL095_4184 [Verrucomicrobiota bacterium]|jgi:hypothetical protein